ncbi:MAG: hypothetical protein ACFFA7_06295 [Promethearchaeota archaeon]
MRGKIITSDQRKEFLYEMLEKIVFNEAQLTILKNGIEKVANGYLTPKDLRKQIIELRVKLIEDLIEFFPFYLKQNLIENKLLNFTDSNESSLISAELEERNNLLEEVGCRINNIYRKLKEKYNV